MEGNRFDALSKALATGTARRSFLKMLAAAPLGGLLVRMGLHDTAGAQTPPPPPSGQCVRPSPLALQEAWACCSQLYSPSRSVSLNSTLIPPPPQCVDNRTGRVDTGCELKLCMDAARCSQGVCFGACSSIDNSNCSGNPNCFCFRADTPSGGFCTRNFNCCQFPHCSTTSQCPNGSICVLGRCSGRCVPVSDACQPGQVGTLPLAPGVVRDAFSNGKTNTDAVTGPPTTPGGRVLPGH